jgi:hypothetical protein
MAPRETSSDAHRCFSRRRRRLDRIIPACLEAGCVDTCCMFDDVVVFALAPLLYVWQGPRWVVSVYLCCSSFQALVL